MKFSKSLSCVPLFLCLILYSHISAQKGRTPLSEKEGKANLEKYAATYHDRTSWEKRASLIKENILNGLQLKPLPAKHDLKPIANGKKVMNGYTVENVAFESMPGFWVTGNLYRPIDNKRKVPGILVPQGHSRTPAEARADEDWQKLCAGLARMGSVVLAYDMVGYSE